MKKLAVSTAAVIAAFGPPAILATSIDMFGGHIQDDMALRIEFLKTVVKIAVWGVCAAATVVNDGPGFVAQRVVSMIVNIGCAVAQARTSTPEDIDRAVTLALAYPSGPLAWGDAVGPATILRILENVCRLTGDPRYRPTPWLRRRARLGVSLLTPEG